MPRARVAALSRYLLRGQLSARGCLRSRAHTLSLVKRDPSQLIFSSSHVRLLHAEPASEGRDATPPAPIPMGKRLKEESKKRKALGKQKNKGNQVIDGWELTVGIEIHAQLNTAKKLFSPAATSFNDEPNTHVAYFDLAIPGSQPVFQKETLIPALRAALALNCSIENVSRFDRKHYFHWDQPSGYQITQYYEPFAKDGRINLLQRDGIAKEDGEGISVGIKQIQMEQDTAKTLAQPGGVYWIDFNRVGVPLIEIITLPEIHHPATAAALVRKVQLLLNAADACVSGMEAGGLRADVNVSVRRSDDPSGPLGQRTEIKNLSSFKAIEDAIIAERDRQISVLESGGIVESETRGWSIGATETRRLRGKEGEVDYRYMPDPDLAPVIIGGDLVDYLRQNMGMSPDAEIDELTQRFDLTPKDASSLVALDGGKRVEYFWNVVGSLADRFGPDSNTPKYLPGFQLAANWILHELGRLTSGRSEAAGQDLGFMENGECRRVPFIHLTDILYYLYERKITAKIAKELLWAVFRRKIPDKYPTITAAADQENLWFKELHADEYRKLALAIVRQDEVMAHFVNYKQYPQGKLMFLVGRMIRLGPEEFIDPKEAERVMKIVLEEKRAVAASNSG
ncbi:aspartyl/glutamyl-tRNA amidotransferase subunit B [Durotheca rogersii]|uniref:aspartyl/glutamyl-tRNA amidotransferase subunit B n=1 Tax=Durotheca rogersii TaxID=419775 RepID=UPI00221ED9CB|nr:aspartyl/glutamyl-tRNA amidotransferase subunit B [Durotheca rogersii]KAI5859861.1 aspartyl/glutamyl-tRNA amidotransferase subunit B [Durotheca rogersii]